MDQNNPNNSNRDNHNALKSSVLSVSTDSLLSTNTAASTINPLSNEANRPTKDYSTALSILQSRYGTGGQALPTPKSKPSDKIQKLNAVQGTAAQRGGSQLTLVSAQSVPNSRSSESEGTSSAAGSSSTVNADDNSQSKKPRKKIGIASLFKGKGKDKKK